MTPITTPIVIEDILGGGEYSEELVGCYFLPVGNGKYDFYSKHGHAKGRNLQKGSLRAFKFEGHAFSWAIYIKEISDTGATGDWNNTAPKIQQDEGGTFTAQAGGNEDADAASSANA